MFHLMQEILKIILVFSDLNPQLFLDRMKNPQTKMFKILLVFSDLNPRHNLTKLSES